MAKTANVMVPAIFCHFFIRKILSTTAQIYKNHLLYQ